MKRVRRPPMMEGLPLDEFIRRNADPIFLHQEEMWEDFDEGINAREHFPMPDGLRESVSFISTETSDDLIVAYAIGAEDVYTMRSLILQRTPSLELLLPPEDRGVVVSHESFPDAERELLRSVVVRGSRVDFRSSLRRYELDLTDVDPEELAEARAVLLQMHRLGGFDLDLG